MQALILAGGEGTRLRPLTSTVPKPVVPLVDQPFIGYMFDWLRSHGVDDVIMSCGFLADGVKSVLGDGSSFGIRLRYVEEPKPLGTGGALKFAEELLEERFFMLNGDVLTDIDLTEQLEQHERTGARATLALIGVDDPSAYGLVRRRDDGSVTEFLEKPGADEVLDTNLVNAGAYILEREILAEMAPAGTNISIERDVFPKLVDHGLYGYEASGYWLDIGTPGRYLQATYDILEGKVNTEVGGAGSTPAGCGCCPPGGVAGRIAAPVLIGDGCGIAERRERRRPRRARPGRADRRGRRSSRIRCCSTASASARARTSAARSSAATSRSASAARSTAAWCSARASRIGDRQRAHRGRARISRGRASRRGDQVLSSGRTLSPRGRRRG